MEDWASRRRGGGGDGEGGGRKSGGSILPEDVHGGGHQCKNGKGEKEACKHGEERGRQVGGMRMWMGSR